MCVCVCVCVCVREREREIERERVIATGTLTGALVVLVAEKLKFFTFGSVWAHVNGKCEDV